MFLIQKNKKQNKICANKPGLTLGCPPLGVMQMDLLFFFLSYMSCPRKNRGRECGTDWLPRRLRWWVTRPSVPWLTELPHFHQERGWGTLPDGGLLRLLPGKNGAG